MKDKKLTSRQKADRLLKQLPLSERKRQLEIRQLIMADQLWRKGQV